MTNSVGTVSSNRIDYPGAFGEIASVSYEYSAATFHQNVHFLKRPELDAGFNPATTWIQIWTEVDSSDALQKDTNALRF